MQALQIRYIWLNEMTEPNGTSLMMQRSKKRLAAGTIRTALATALTLGWLVGCSEWGEGDNAPTIFDTPEEKAARDERRSQSPAVTIYGKPYVFVSAVIDGKQSVPDSDPPPRIILEDHLVKGSDGCHAISARAGIFTPSGYEFSLMESGPLQDEAHLAQYPCTEPGRQRWPALRALEDRVWALSIDASGILEMKDYSGAPYRFRLQPAPAP
jgi:hypothetical protein